MLLAPLAIQQLDLDGGKDVDASRRHEICKQGFGGSVHDPPNQIEANDGRLMSNLIPLAFNPTYPDNMQCSPVCLIFTGIPTS
jgi:hypothetical protein